MAATEGIGPFKGVPSHGRGRRRGKPRACLGGADGRFGGDAMAMVAVPVGDGRPGGSGMHQAGQKMVQEQRTVVQRDVHPRAREALELRERLESREIFIPREAMVELLGYLLGQTTHLRASLNRLQAGGRCFVHSVEWMSVRFISASERPIMVK